MNNRLKAEALKSTFDFVRGKSDFERASSDGLQLKGTRAGLQQRTVGGNARACGMMPSPRRMTGREGDSSLKHRRIAAAPCFSKARGVSFGAFGSNSRKDVSYGAIRAHGLIASIDFMGAPCGKPSGLPFPVLRSVNPHGAARPLTGVDGFDNSNTGATAMTLHAAAGACARAYNLRVCRLLNFINRLTGRAGGVRPLGSYPEEWRVQVPSIFKVNPELLELAHAEALKHSREVRHV